jgi:hypothetical protein
MDWRLFVRKEEEIWHERFFPSLIAAGAVFLITLILQIGGFDIVLLTSISASIVILTSQAWHKLTVLGTTFYAYFLAIVTGFFFKYIHVTFELNLATISFLTICTVTLAIYLLNIFHPPAVGIALGIVLYAGSVNTLVSILSFTFAVFILVKGAMYTYYHHLKWKHFHHEFLTWNKKLFKIHKP